MRCLEFQASYSSPEQTISHHFQREFQLCYQPAIALRNQALHSFEVLTHLQPHRSKLYASNWLALLNGSTLDLPFHRWLLSETCKQMRWWRKHYDADSPQILSLNLSPGRLLSPGLIPLLQCILRRNELLPEHLQIEVPLNWMMRNTASAQAVILQLKQAGFRICIDDFEPEQLSCAYLRSLSVDAIKVSVACTQRTTWDRHLACRLGTVIAAADDWGISVIFKGVETREQLNCAQTLGCAYAQGYLLSEPVDPHQATALITAQAKRSHLQLDSHLAAMYGLSQFAQRFLGRVIVARYWEETKPLQGWLDVLKPYQSLDKPGELSRSVEAIEFDPIRQQELQAWAHQFIHRCDRILHGFEQMLLQSELTADDQALLGVAP